jgi:hypothetical protein
VGLLAGASGAVAAEASGGDVAAAAYGFVTKLEIGVPGTADARICTGALIRPRVVLTATACVVTTAHPDPLATSALAITARFPSAVAIRVVDVRPNVAPGLSLAVLAKPAQVAVAPLGTAAAVVGDSLTAAGFGRTRTEWIADQPHTVGFGVQQASATQLDVAPAGTADAGLCRGDAGAPLVRGTGQDSVELVGIAVAAWQKGCLGETDTRGEAVARPVSTLPVLPAATGDLLDQLTLSPTDSGTAPAAAAGFGSAVAVADFNKDGFPDIAVGAPADKTGPANDVASGTVTVFSGGPNGPTIGTRILQTSFKAADEAGDRFGATLAVGDFNKDTFPDLAIGTPGEVVGTIKAGSIAIFNGSSAGLGTPHSIDQDDLGLKDLAGDLFGSAFAAGDFNGDGFTDLAVGAPGKLIDTARSGQVVVLKGSAAGLVLGWVVDQKAAAGANEAGDLFGTSLAAGNVFGPKTGTVFTDLVIGAPGESPGSDPQSGTIFVIPGAKAGPIADGFGVTQSGNGGVNETGDRFGAAVATGDFNKDGWADIVVGSPGELPGADPQSGSTTVIPGGNTALGKGFGVVARDDGAEPLAGDLFGTAVATGDANGDGYADLIVGSPGRSAGAGTISFYVGGPVSTARPNSVTTGRAIGQPDVYGTDEPDDRFGAALAFGDLNKDGKADAVVGSPGEGAPGEPDAGVVVTLSKVVG